MESEGKKGSSGPYVEVILCLVLVLVRTFRRFCEMCENAYFTWRSSHDRGINSSFFFDVNVRLQAIAAKNVSCRI